MDIASRKLLIIEQLMGVENPNKLEQIETFFKEEVKDVWDELPQAVREKIEKSQEESRNNETVPHHKVMESIKSKYNLV